MVTLRYLRCNMLLLCSALQSYSVILDKMKKLKNIPYWLHQLTKAVYEKCWDASRGYLADTPDKKAFSMHAQIFAVLTNTIPEIDQKTFVMRFINDKSLIQPTMYFRFYLTQALKKTGLADHYLETLGLWNDMLEKGLTTFAENPDPTRSDCHAWSASPDYDFLATVAGIRPGTPGFKTVEIEPALGKAFVHKRTNAPSCRNNKF